MAPFNFRNRAPKKTTTNTSSSKNYAPKSNTTKTNKTTTNSRENRDGRSNTTRNTIPPVSKSTINKESQQFCCAPCYDQVRGGINPKSCFAGKENYVSSKYTAPTGTVLPTREGKNGVFFYIDKNGNEAKCNFGTTPVGCQRKTRQTPSLKKQEDTISLDGVTVVQKKTTPVDPKQVVSKKDEIIFNANKLTETQKDSEKATSSKSAFIPKQTEDVKKRAGRADTGGQSPIIFNKDISDGELPTAGQNYKDTIKTIEENIDGNLPGLDGSTKGGTFVKSSDIAYGGTISGPIGGVSKSITNESIKKVRKEVSKKEEPRNKVIKDYISKTTKLSDVSGPSLPSPGGLGGPIGSPRQPLPSGPNRSQDVVKPEIRGRDTAPSICTDEQALNYNQACISDIQCCLYEDSLRDPIECSDAETSELRIKIDSIDSQIKVLEQRIDEIENEPEYVPNVEDNTPSGTEYSNLTSNNVFYTTLPGIEKFTKEGVYVRSTVLDIEGNSNQSTQSKGNADYSDSTKWDAYVNEDLGSVYFQLNLVNGEEGPIINNLSQGDDADLYREFCLAKGYEYNYFRKVSNRLKYSSKGRPSTQLYCVDTEFIVTEDVADVKMVFAANQWDGFVLPKSETDSEVKITMDVMVKFDADVIINKCLAESEVPYIDLNTLYDTTNCDIVIFTDDLKNKSVFKQTKKRAQDIDSETKQVNWVYDDEDVEIWNRSGLQVEPTQEFCNRVGATLYNSNNLYNNRQRKYYDDSEFIPLYSSNEEYADYRNTLTNDIESYAQLVNTLNDAGYQVNGFQYAQSNYYDLINTSNVCKLEAPLLNEGYTTMVQEYGVMIKQLYDLDDTLDFCVAKYEVLTREINVLNTEKKKFNTLFEKKKELRAKKQKELTDLEISYEEIEKKNKDLISGSRNNSDIARYKVKASEDQSLFQKQSREIKIDIQNLGLDITDIKECIDNLNEQIKSAEEQRLISEDCKELRENLISVLDTLILNNDSITKKTKSLYENWERVIEATYRSYLENTIENVVDYLEGTNIDLTLEVDNNLGTITSDKVYKYTKLTSYSRENIWEFDKTRSYSGILLEGSEANVDLVKRKVNGSETLFSPLWQRITLTLDNQQCKQLRLCYPDKQFFVGLTINNPKNCQTTLLVDNIEIDTEANYIKKLYSTSLPPSFNLTPVIDDKKSWVYSDGGVMTSDTKTIFTEPQERSQSGVEYRYTDYTVNHSKLVVNSKETTFRIDPANAVECDVYGFWQEIDCDTCDTAYSCSTGTTLTYTNPTGGTIGLSGTVVTSSFNCEDISIQLRTNNDTWRSGVYKTTGSVDLARSISFSVVKESESKPRYQQRVSTSPYVNNVAKNSGVFNQGVANITPKSLSAGFDIQQSQCNTTIIEIKNNDDTYTLIGEELDGTLGFYKYSADTNTVSEVTSFIDQQCCLRVSNLVNKKFRLDKPNYTWSGGQCVWNENITVIENCDSDCSYFGTEPIKTDYVSSGETLTATCTDTPVCIKPLEYLDKDPNDVNIKPQFDEMVLSNLIDAKSRQVISGYPMLQLFYNQYRDASGCGISLTNRLGVETTFEVMDLIGDYWTEVIEQVIPSTTIWDGTKNSGKLYRNTIFEQTKFPYARYAINFDEAECDITGITDYHVGVNTGSTIEINSECIKGDCLGDEMIGCNAERKVLLVEKSKLEQKINDLTGILNLIDGVTTSEQTTDETDGRKAKAEASKDTTPPPTGADGVLSDGSSLKGNSPSSKTAEASAKDFMKSSDISSAKGNTEIQYCNKKQALNYRKPCQKDGPCCRLESDKPDMVTICNDKIATNYKQACHSLTNCCIYTKPLAAIKLCEDIKALNYNEPCASDTQCCRYSTFSDQSRDGFVETTNTTTEQNEFAGTTVLGNKGVPITEISSKKGTKIEEENIYSEQQTLTQTNLNTTTLAGKTGAGISQTDITQQEKGDTDTYGSPTYSNTTTTNKGTLGTFNSNSSTTNTSLGGNLGG